MRRLIVEFPLKGFATVSPLQNVKLFKILRILRLDMKEFSAVIKIEFADKHNGIGELFPASPKAEIKYELLDENEGSYTYFLRVKSLPGQQRPVRLSPLAKGGYISVPFEIMDEKLKSNLPGRYQSDQKHTRIHYEIRNDI